VNTMTSPAVLLLACSTAAAQPATFRGLGFESTKGISAAGLAVIGQSSVSVLRWTEATGTVVMPSPAGAPLWQATTISGDGSMVVGPFNRLTAPAMTLARKVLDVSRNTAARHSLTGGRSRAGDRDRTDDIQLGKPAWKPFRNSGKDLD
jgi:hypothetical protein